LPGISPHKILMYEISLIFPNIARAKRFLHDQIKIQHYINLAKNFQPKHELILPLSPQIICTPQHLINV